MFVSKESNILCKKHFLRQKHNKGSNCDSKRKTVADASKCSAKLTGSFSYKTAQTVSGTTV